MRLNFKNHSRLVAEAKGIDADEARDIIRRAADIANGRQLIELLRAVERPVIEEKSKQLFEARGLGDFSKPGNPILKEFVTKIVTAKGGIEEKIAFVDGCIAGKFFNAKKFTSSKSGNFTAFLNTSDPIMSQLAGWFMNWKPQIDKNGTVAVGKMEAVMIFLAKDGGKGSEGTFGDAYCGGKLIEVKTGGGHLGKGAGAYLTSAKGWMTGELKRLGIEGVDPLKGATGAKNNAVLKINEALKKAKRKPAVFWTEFFKQVTGETVAHKGILDDPNFIDISAYSTAVGYEKYKKQTGFDMVSLLDTEKKFGMFVNWHSGDDVIATYKTSSWSMDYSMSWGGGGRGDGFSPRLYTGSKGYRLK